jgi:hypothetical protein
MKNKQQLLAQLESRVRDVVERAMNKQPVEGQFEELKSEWPLTDDKSKARKVARQLAGGCNAAGGQPYLWVIGVREPKGDVAGDLIGAHETDPGKWYGPVQTCFDDESPELLCSIPVKIKEKVVYGLLFDSERVPYVVHAEIENRKEVPFRVGTNTNSASRSQLLRLLLSAADRTETEVVDAHCEISGVRLGWTPTTLDLTVTASFFVRPPAGTTLTIPAHKCSIGLLGNGQDLDVAALDTDVTLWVKSDNKAGRIWMHREDADSPRIPKAKLAASGQIRIEHDCSVDLSLSADLPRTDAGWKDIVVRFECTSPSLTLSTRFGSPRHGPADDPSNFTTHFTLE